VLTAWGHSITTETQSHMLGALAALPIDSSPPFVKARSALLVSPSATQGAGESRQFERRLHANLTQHPACAIGGTARCRNGTYLGEQHRQALGEVGVRRIDAYRTPDDVNRAINLSSIVRSDRRALHGGDDSNLDRITVLRRPLLEWQVRAEGTAIEVEDHIELFGSSAPTNCVDPAQRRRRIKRDKLWMH
jgi:hypothetical protein